MWRHCGFFGKQNCFRKTNWFPSKYELPTCTWGHMQKLFWSKCTWKSSPARFYVNYLLKLLIKKENILTIGLTDKNKFFLFLFETFSLCIKSLSKCMFIWSFDAAKANCCLHKSFALQQLSAQRLNSTGWSWDPSKLYLLSFLHLSSLTTIATRKIINWQLVTKN